MVPLPPPETRVTDIADIIHFFLIETRIGARAVRVRNALLKHQAEERE